MSTSESHPFGGRRITFDTVSLDQPIDTHLKALLLRNTFQRNAFYGITLDAGFANRTSSRVAQPAYTGTFEVDLVANDFGSGADANVTTPFWAGFTEVRRSGGLQATS
jgi:hypothetical protein